MHVIFLSLFLVSNAVSLHLRQQKKITLVVCLLRWWRIGLHYTHSRSVSLLVLRLQFVITRVILPVEPPGKNCVLRGGDLSCSHQRAMKGASLFIDSADHASYGRYVLNVYGEKLGVSRRESSAKYNIISFRLRKHTYASSSRGRVSLRRHRDRIVMLSLFLSRLIVESVQTNVKFRSESFQRYHRELGTIPQDKVIEMLSR